MPVNELLRSILVCPTCKGGLAYHEAGHKTPEGFVCTPCARFYPVIDDIPTMLVDAARPWPLTEAHPASAKHPIKEKK